MNSLDFSSIYTRIMGIGASVQKDANGANNLNHPPPPPPPENKSKSVVPPENKKFANESNQKEPEYEKNSSTSDRVQNFVEEDSDSEYSVHNKYFGRKEKVKRSGSAPKESSEGQIQLVCDFNNILRV
jgi:hypothetical protein